VDIYVLSGDCSIIFGGRGLSIGFCFGWPIGATAEKDEAGVEVCGEAIGTFVDCASPTNFHARSVIGKASIVTIPP
jgi:hypothetical protein